jgi:hypothetical protein
MAERAVAKASIFVTIAPHSGSVKTVYCLVSVTRNYTSNLNDAGSICQPTNKTPGTKEYSVSMTLQRYWEPGASHYSEKFLQDELVSQVLVDYVIGPASPVTGDLVETGTGYITSATKTDNSTDIGTMDVTITLTQDPVLSVTA